jgi:hypothetical protein
MIRKKGKKTWASAKRKNIIRTVGKCIHCNDDISSDMSFICYYHPRHEPIKPAHYSCYKTEAEKEQNAKSR